jgi:hypothetical protein
MSFKETWHLHNKTVGMNRVITLKDNGATFIVTILDLPTPAPQGFGAAPTPQTAVFGNLAEAKGFAELQVLKSLADGYVDTQ